MKSVWWDGDLCRVEGKCEICIQRNVICAEMMRYDSTFRVRGIIQYNTVVYVTNVSFPIRSVKHLSQSGENDAIHCPLHDVHVHVQYYNQLNNNQSFHSKLHPLEFISVHPHIICICICIRYTFSVHTRYTFQIFNLQTNKDDT